MTNKTYENGTDKFHQPNPLIVDADGAGMIPCEWCGQMFTPVRAWSRFCRNSHRVSAFLKRNGKQGS
jgi:uncharacterized C2H2 Zn-finger protein